MTLGVPLPPGVTILGDNVRFVVPDGWQPPPLPHASVEALWRLQARPAMHVLCIILHFLLSFIRKPFRSPRRRLRSRSQEARLLPRCRLLPRRLVASSWAGP